MGLDLGWFRGADRDQTDSDQNQTEGVKHGVYCICYGFIWEFMVNFDVSNGIKRDPTRIKRNV